LFSLEILKQLLKEKCVLNYVYSLSVGTCMERTFVSSDRRTIQRERWRR